MVSTLRRSIAAAACLAALATTLAGSVAPNTTIRVLQMNLCDSGLASCFTNRAVSAAAAVIREDRPDVVTVNEVCQDDVAVLGRVMESVHSGGTVVSAFRAAPDRRTGAVTRCLNGQAYGVGLVVRQRAPGHVVTGGEYPDQDPGDPEIRVWLCIAASDFDACTTHLATNAPVAREQSQFLLNTVLTARSPTVVSGDFNLQQPTGPPGFRAIGDGAVQHVVTTGGFVVRSGRSFGMAGTTDHPALLVTLTLR